MKSSWVLGLLGATALLAATTASVKGLRLPLLDAAGRPTRIVSAEEFSGSLDAPRMRQAMIEFFAPDKIDGAAIGKMAFDAATYFRAKDEVAGEGMLHLESARGTATGEGYVYDVARNELHVRRGFELRTPDATITGDEADLALENASGGLEILRFEVRGHVVAVPINKTKYGYQRARGDKATYTASDHLLRVAPPVWVVDQQGHEARVDIKEMTFRLGL